MNKRKSMIVSLGIAIPLALPAIVITSLSQTNNISKTNLNTQNNSLTKGLDIYSKPSKTIAIQSKHNSNQKVLTNTKTKDEKNKKPTLLLIIMNVMAVLALGSIIGVFILKFKKHKKTNSPKKNKSSSNKKSKKGSSFKGGKKGFVPQIDTELITPLTKKNKTNKKKDEDDFWKKINSL
ncbi:MAG: hypothetical protein HRT98_00020 [Mycoplasmatales bacterium]|nr:hypothetical protein [Mycoplasmatales bacterium]